MVTLQTAENALKNVYLGVISNQLNVAVNPLLAQIKHSTSNIYGKEIRKAAPVGINGGIGAGAEDGELPLTSKTNYVQFVAQLKNLYGRLDITDKAIRATSNNISSFVNLLNDEMERLIEASNFNLGRMLYGTGDGVIAVVDAVNSTQGFVRLLGSGIQNFVEGMVVRMQDISGSNKHLNYTFTVTKIDKANNYVYVTNHNDLYNGSIAKNSKIWVQNSWDSEITGIEGIFSNDTLYGLTKADNPWLNPYVSTDTTYISDNAIQSVIDHLEDYANSTVNYIATTKAVRRLYQEYLSAYRRNIDVTELAGGFKTITYNGIPVVGDRFVPDNTMYLLNTNDFTMYELCDWKWLEDESGRILKQNPNYPTYTATLVKYCELMCDRPNGQAKIANIATTLTPPVEDDTSGSQS